MIDRNDPLHNSQHPTSDSQAPLTERMRESVSALFDGEADDLEWRRLLSSEQPEAVRGAWRDYQLQRDALQGLDMRFANLDISARVRAAIAADVAPAATAVAGARWWRPLASMAVATVVVIGARSFNPSIGLDGGRDERAVAQTSSNLGRVYPSSINPALGNVAFNTPLSGGALTGSMFPKNETLGSGFGGAQNVGFDADQQAQQRLQQYLLRHTERASLNNGQGVINFAKVSQLNAE